MALDWKSVESFSKQLVKKIHLDGINSSYAIAGGCYKSIITTRPPRDIDVWPYSENDRTVIVESLIKSGGVLVDDNLFNSRFIVNGNVVEVVCKKSNNFKGVFEYFDIALSCVGASFESGFFTESFVHPLVKQSVANGTPLLIIPMPNMPFLLVTLERVKRYAQELGFLYPKEQVEYLKGKYYEQPIEKRRMLLENYELVTGQKYEGF
ncbi:hypothetical protein LWC08_03090 [Desulfobaculum bizertense]|uniref:hypothetical protein n=1 Tax=Desulfobaculum bizertense TaxID=376490 RepID=UPI001F35DEC2|nr:hypothetical protein [Desulfobaculum bizertense]UIJ38569.1 hypothetical protein LWC08_03090 [Desulfobaculum bizertense]